MRDDLANAARSGSLTDVGATQRGWAIFFARVVLGLIFGMAGFWKCFTLTPIGHAQRLFVTPYAETWIPTWLLWASGVTIPVVELFAGWLLVIGWRTRESLIALGFVLITVTYGHLLKEALFTPIYHIIPRLGLLLFILMQPRADDRLSVDAWLDRRSNRRP